MTRFKEQKRINEAINHKNNDELLWALEYCKMRLSLSKMKEHKKHWQKQIQNVKEAFDLIQE